MKLLIRNVQKDHEIQARVKMHTSVVDEYTQAMRNGDDFPDIVVFDDEQTYWLADGFHRIDAAIKCERETINAEIKPGTRRDAILYAVGANTTHGLRRTNADKRRAVEILLKDPEFSQFSDRKIAAMCAVSNRFVGKVRNELSVNGSQIKRVREVSRAGKTYTMDATNIGARNTSKANPATTACSKRLPVTDGDFGVPTVGPTLSSRALAEWHKIVPPLASPLNGSINRCTPEVQRIETGSADDLDKHSVTVRSSATAPFICALHDENLGGPAALALAERAKEAISALISALDNMNANIRHYAVCGLGRVADVTKDIIPMLILRFTDADEAVCEAAANALGFIGEPALPAIINALGSTDSQIRFYSAFALGAMEIPAAVPALRKASCDADEAVREIATHALSQIQNTGALKVTDADETEHVNPAVVAPSQLESAIDSVCRALICDEKIVLKLPDEINDEILFWVMERIEAAASAPNTFSEVVTAIHWHAKAVSNILYQIITGINVSRIVEKFHQLDRKICIDELPQDVEELTHHLLTRFNQKIGSR